MKKKLLTFILLLIFPLIVFASSDYEIKDYKVTIGIDNNKYTYTENLDIDFYSSEKYITRILDDTNHNFKVNKNYNIETSNQSIAKIYSDKTTDDYNITYNIDSNKEKNYYEFLIVNNYDTAIDNMSFEITLPHSLTSNNITIKIGNEEITNLVDYSVKDKVITGHYNKKINPNETITVIVDYGKFYMNSSTLICTITPIILTIISYLLWYFFGKDLPTKIEKTSKFAKNITPIHLALTDHQNITDEDSYYLLLNLASQGYITIVENKKEYSIKKNKEYNGKNYIESLFMKTIFRAGESISLSEYINIVQEKRDNKKHLYQADRVEAKYLKRKFKNASITIQEYLKEQNESSKYFETQPDKIKNILILMIAVILVLVTSLPFIEINVLTLLPLSIIISIILLYIIINFVKNINIQKSYLSTIVFIIGTIVLIIMTIPSFQRNIGFIIAFIVSIICSIIILFIYKYMPKRTIYGQNIYNKIEGFKTFINNITKEELSRVLELNEDYLYEILPISYELGISDKVLELLKKYNKSEPSWYQMSGKFSYNSLNNSIINLKQILTEAK